GGTGVALLMEPGEIGTKNAGSRLVGPGRVAKACTEEPNCLSDVLAVGLDGVGGGVLLDRQVPQEFGECLLHQKRALVSDSVCACCWAAWACSRAFSLRTATSNQVRLKRGSAAWSRKALTRASRLSSS